MAKRIATIGFFDGVHKGHRFLLEHLRTEGLQRGLAPLAVTFDQHPRAVLDCDYVPRLLTTLEERRSLLSREAEVAVLSFADIRELTAADFMRLLHDQYQVEALLMGYDHRFGSDGLCHPNEYRQAGEEAGIEVVTLGEFTEGEWHVSSTEIRRALENGNIALANELLGYSYELSGTIVHGNEIGRKIGFPTANIQPDCTEKIVPKNGVYAAFTQVQSIGLTRSILNIGTNPTIGNRERTIELHIPGFHGDLYGQHLTIRFERFMREEKKFCSLAELQQQIQADLSVL